MTPDLPARLAASGAELVETHISWVFLTADRAFKVKKPVDFGFLDYTSRDKRRDACDAEVALNRRLAPAVYLRVVPITETPGGALRFGGDGAAVDWAVEMVRLNDDHRADARLRRGALGADDVDRVAARLAAFHRDAPTSPEIARFGEASAVAVNVRENFAQTRGRLEGALSAEEAAEIEAWQLSFLTDRRHLFAERAARGRVRDGHGDLRLDHVYLDTGVPGEGDVTVVDGIEFNERFRFGDVAADLAFLSMDLAWHDRVDLAERLLATYARESGDHDLYALVDFYESYRAFVRGKIDLFVAGDPRTPAPVRQRKQDEARRHLILALASERRRIAPAVVVAVGGVVASGKSTVADELGAMLEAPVVASDRVRKQLLGVDVTTSVAGRPDAYGAAMTRRTYDEVIRRAEVVLGSGRPVVLDATFQGADGRRAARTLAARHRVPFVFVECRAERDVLARRLRARGDDGGSVSDARIDLLDRSLAGWAPITADGAVSPDEHVVLRTDGERAGRPAGWDGLLRRLPLPREPSSERPARPMTDEAHDDSTVA